MAKITNPIRFSDHFGIKSSDLFALGALDPTLNVDTGLFIDPLLLATSSHAEMSNQAVNRYEAHFNRVIGFLRASSAINDFAWQTA